MSQLISKDYKQIHPTSISLRTHFLFFLSYLSLWPSLFLLNINLSIQTRSILISHFPVFSLLQVMNCLQKEKLKVTGIGESRYGGQWTNTTYPIFGSWLSGHQQVWRGIWEERWYWCTQKCKYWLSGLNFITLYWIRICNPSLCLSTTAYRMVFGTSLSQK